MDAESLPLPERLLASPGFLMLQLLRRAKRRVEGMPEPPRLPRMMVLATIEEFGPQSQRAMCRRLGVDPGDMVRIIDGLEAAGHATRDRDPADRRRHAIAITPEGEAWLRMASAELHERAAIILPGLDDEERDTVVRLLRRALDCAGAASAEAA